MFKSTRSHCSSVLNVTGWCSDGCTIYYTTVWLLHQFKPKHIYIMIVHSTILTLAVVSRTRSYSIKIHSRQLFSSSPWGQSGTPSQRSMEGRQRELKHWKYPILHWSWGGKVPGTEVGQCSSSDLSAQSGSPSHNQLCGMHWKEYTHWKWSTSQVGGWGVTGPGVIYHRKGTCT